MVSATYILAVRRAPRLSCLLAVLQMLLAYAWWPNPVSAFLLLAAGDNVARSFAVPERIPNAD